MRLDDYFTTIWTGASHWAGVQLSNMADVKVGSDFTMKLLSNLDCTLSVLVDFLGDDLTRRLILTSTLSTAAATGRGEWSAHNFGWAVDVKSTTLSIDEVYQAVLKACYNQNAQVDQIEREKSWVHIGLLRPKTGEYGRGQIFYRQPGYGGKPVFDRSVKGELRLTAPLPKLNPNNYVPLIKQSNPSLAWQRNTKDKYLPSQSCLVSDWM